MMLAQAVFDALYGSWEVMQDYLSPGLFIATNMGLALATFAARMLQQDDIHRGTDQS